MIKEEEKKRLKRTEESSVQLMGAKEHNGTD